MCCLSFIIPKANIMLLIQTMRYLSMLTLFVSFMSRRSLSGSIGFGGELTPQISSFSISSITASFTQASTSGCDGLQPNRFSADVPSVGSAKLGKLSRCRLWCFST